MLILTNVIFDTICITLSAGHARYKRIKRHGFQTFSKIMAGLQLSWAAADACRHLPWWPKKTAATSRRVKSRKERVKTR